MFYSYSLGIEAAYSKKDYRIIFEEVETYDENSILYDIYVNNKNTRYYSYPIIKELKDTYIVSKLKWDGEKNTLDYSYQRHIEKNGIPTIYIDDINIIQHYYTTIELEGVCEQYFENYMKDHISEMKFVYSNEDDFVVFSFTIANKNENYEYNINRYNYDFVDESGN